MIEKDSSDYSNNRFFFSLFFFKKNFTLAILHATNQPMLNSKMKFILKVSKDVLLPRSKVRLDMQVDYVICTIHNLHPYIRRGGGVFLFFVHFCFISNYLSQF